MASKKRKPVTTFNQWSCNECDLLLDFEEFKRHLTEKHGVTEMKGSRRMLMHLDGDRWFQSDYEWVIDGKTYIQSVRTARSGDDLCKWGCGE